MVYVLLLFQQLFKQPTTKAKTGVTRCGKNHEEKCLKRNF
jgi:hypothetical protein